MTSSSCPCPKTQLGSVRTRPAISLMFRGGLEYGRTAVGTSEPKAVYTPLILIDTRFRLPGQFLLAERNRGDFKVVNGVFSPVYRNRVRLGRLLQTRRFKLAPYVDAEAFYSAQADEFNQFRYSAGLNWVITRRVILDGYYTRQHNVKISSPNVNALGIKLELYFR